MAPTRVASGVNVSVIMHSQGYDSVKAGTRQLEHVGLSSCYILDKSSWVAAPTIPLQRATESCFPSSWAWDQGSEVILLRLHVPHWGFAWGF